MRITNVKRIPHISISIFVISSILYSQQLDGSGAPILWDNVKRISFDSSFSAVPQIMANGDTIHLLWFGLSGEPEPGWGIQYARSTDGGISFTPQHMLVPFDSAGSFGLLATAMRIVYVIYPALVRPSPSPYWNAAIVRSTNAGETWEGKEIIGDYFAYAVAARDSHVYVHAGFTENNFFRSAMLLSHDFGMTWDTVRVQLWRGPNVAGLALTPKALHLIRSIGVAGYQEVFYNRSTDFGYTFTPEETLSVNDGYNGSNPRLVSNGTTLFAAWDDQEYGGNFSGTIVMRRSTDEGLTWLPEQVISQFSTAAFCDVAVDGNIVGVVWDNDDEIDSLNAIRFRISDTNGETWSPSVNLSKNTLHAGNPTISIARSKIHVAWWQDGEIYYRRGIIQPTFVQQEEIVPFQIALWQNYPNPFNNSTIISYTIPREVVINLRLYDALGRLVRNLYEGKREAGSYSLHLSSGDLSSGVYLLVLDAGGIERDVRKIVLLR